MSKENPEINPESSDPQKALKPQYINLKEIKDDRERIEAENILDKWVENIYKDISNLLEKYDLNIYQLSFLHPGTRNPILLARGDLFQTAILATTAARQLKTQIDEKLKT